MKTKILVITMILTFASCKNKPNQKGNQPIKSAAPAKVTPYQDSLQNIYDVNAIKILEDARILNSKTLIAAFFSAQPLKPISIKSDTIITANKKRAIDYEISENHYESNVRYKNLIIWQTSNDEKKKVFEYTAKIERGVSVIPQIDKRRELWMVLCNKNNARDLIEEMYSENTLYFNHKPIVKGRKLLIDEYQYMNDETYELFLQPEYVDQVNDNIVFEIGQCSGGYRGKYILIWRKESDGQWRIFIDSNI